MATLQVIIAIGYLFIAAQFLFASRQTKSSKAKRSLLLLIGTFVLCAFCGYLAHVMKIPFKVHFASEFILAAVTWSYVLTNQANVVIQGIERHDRY